MLEGVISEEVLFGLETSNFKGIREDAVCAASAMSRTTEMSFVWFLFIIRLVPPVKTDSSLLGVNVTRGKSRELKVVGVRRCFVYMLGFNLTSADRDMTASKSVDDFPEVAGLVVSTGTCLGETVRG